MLSSRKFGWSESGVRNFGKVGVGFSYFTSNSAISYNHSKPIMTLFTVLT